MMREKISERTHGCETDVHALQRLFRFYDKDGTGKLTIDEFGSALLNLGLPIERRLVGGEGRSQDSVNTLFKGRTLVRHDPSPLC
jgi:Ca2+-binding EF-hand superfamily protein